MDRIKLIEIRLTFRRVSHWGRTIIESLLKNDSSESPFDVSRPPTHSLYERVDVDSV